MSRFFLQLTFLFAFAFAAVNAIVIAAGNRQPPHPATAGFTVGCVQPAQPCWYGIIPGVTNADEARQLMEQVGYERVSIAPSRYGDEAHIYIMKTDPSLCQTELLYNPANRRIQRIQLACDRLRLGDLGSAAGMPIGVQKTSGYAARLLFAHNIAVIDTMPVDRTSLYSYITLIDISPMNARASAEPTFGWYGPLPEWRYCRLQPDAPVCPLPEVGR